MGHESPPGDWAAGGGLGEGYSGREDGGTFGQGGAGGSSYRSAGGRPYTGCVRRASGSQGGRR